MTVQSWNRSFQKRQTKIIPASSQRNKKSLFSRLKRSKIFQILSWPIRNKYFRSFMVLAILAAAVGLLYVVRDIPSPRRLTSKENFPVSTQIFDRRGALLYEIFGDENRTPIKIDDLPPYVLQATIAIEDKNFYNHFGFDIRGIARAVFTNLQGNSTVGGSTITQQLVKNALLTKEKSWQRKTKEAVLAVLTEVIYSKHDILEMYLNYISYGGTAVGIESASRLYFDKSAKDLTLSEAALLAGLPQAPSRYSPFASDATAAKNRQAEVLRRMVEDDYITALEAEDAKAQKLTFAITRNDIAAPHFVFYVRDLLYEKYGVETVEKGGLRVTTSLDLELQNIAQASVSAQVAGLQRQRVGNGAALILKPNTGEILAMVGSKDYFNTEDDGQVNVTLSQRQPGSSIKPIMYATAFQEKVLNPGSVLLDIPTCFKVAGQKEYCPKNYDGSFRGPVTIRQSMGNSLNIPAVRSLKLIGLEKFIAQARRMGITSWTDPSRYGLSLTLGGGEVKMIDLAQAFAVIANAGVKTPVTPILKIEDYQGTVWEEVNIEERQSDLATMNLYNDEQKLGDLERVMDQAPAYLTAHIMQDNKARQAAFGANSKLVIKGQVVSAKTGTTNDLKDNWTVGFTPEFLVITWVGNNDGTSMNQSLVSGITGAAPIFNDLMTYVLAGREPLWQQKPGDVLSGALCLTGMPPNAGDSCSIQTNELYWRQSLPTNTRQVTSEIWVKADTGVPPLPGENQDNLVLESHTIYQDPLTEGYCQDCRRATTPEGEVIYEQHVVTTEERAQTITQ